MKLLKNREKYFQNENLNFDDITALAPLCYGIAISDIVNCSVFDLIVNLYTFGEFFSLFDRPFNCPNENFFQNHKYF